MTTAQIIAAVLLAPFSLAFLYAAIHEFRRFKSEGRANYGLVYNEETGTTHVTGIEDGTEGFDPEDFDPNDYRDPELVAAEQAEAEAQAEAERLAAEAELAEAEQGEEAMPEESPSHASEADEDGAEDTRRDPSATGRKAP